VFALTFSELHLLDGCSVETWGIEDQLATDDVVNWGQYCRIQRRRFIPSIFNVRTAGSKLTAFVVTDSQLQQRYVHLYRH
jgi:hypothetical protein